MVVGSGECSIHILVVSSMGNVNAIHRDVAAGIAILLEAGGLVTTANPPENPDTDPIEDVRLGSRLYLAIRYAT